MMNSGMEAPRRSSITRHWQHMRRIHHAAARSVHTPAHKHRRPSSGGGSLLYHMRELGANQERGSGELTTHSAHG